MDIEPDDELKDHLVGRLQAKYSTPRTGIHVSDLVYCLRQAYFRRKNPKPVQREAVGFYVSGRKHHEVLQALHGSDFEVEVERWGVQGHIDIMDGVPIEITETRAGRFRDIVISEHKKDQLRFYNVLTGTTEGRFIILDLVPKRPGDIIRCFKTRITRDEFERAEHELRWRVSALNTALENEDPSPLPKAFYDWKCKSCAYRDNCGRTG